MVIYKFMYWVTPQFKYCSFSGGAVSYPAEKRVVHPV